QCLKIALLFDVSTCDSVDARNPRRLRGAILLNEILTVCTWRGRLFEAICWIVHIKSRITRQWVILIRHRRVNSFLEKFSFSEMCSQDHHAVSQRQRKTVQVIGIARRRGGESPRGSCHSLCLVKSIERPAAAIPDKHHALKSALFFQVA